MQGHGDAPGRHVAQMKTILADGVAEAHAAPPCDTHLERTEIIVEQRARPHPECLAARDRRGMEGEQLAGVVRTQVPTRILVNLRRAGKRRGQGQEGVEHGRVGGRRGKVEQIQARAVPGIIRRRRFALQMPGVIGGGQGVDEIGGIGLQADEVAAETRAQPSPIGPLTASAGGRLRRGNKLKRA